MAQRFDVLAWPVDRTWPVLGSCLQLVLVCSAVLLLVCGFLAAGRFAQITPFVRDAFARSSGSLATVPLLAGIYVGVLLELFESDDAARRPCVLCQLWGTSCSRPDSLFASWSYGVYLAVLLPATAMQAGLLLSAAAMCKQKERVVTSRLVTANYALLIVLHVNYTLNTNAQLLRCAGAGPNAGAPGPSQIVLSVRLLVFTLMLFSLDVLAEVQTTVHRARATRFALLRLLQLGGVAAFNLLYDEERLPWPLMCTHLGLGLILVFLDVLELPRFAKLEGVGKQAEREDFAPSAPPQDRVLDRREAVLDLAAPDARNKCSAFEVEPSRRRKFVLTFHNKSRWPGAQEPAAKKQA